VKILYHHRIASKDGQYVHIEELTKSLKKLGHEIIMVGPSAIDNHEFGSSGGVVQFLKKYIPKIFYEIVEFGYAFYAYVKLVKAINIYKPDVIYERYSLYMPAGIWIKKKYGLPFFLEVNAPLYDERSKFDGIAIPWLARWTERFTWKNADHVLPVTHVLANRIVREGVSEAQITVIPNGIDPDKFSDQITTEYAKEQLGLSGKLVLGFTGFMREWHGLEDVLELLVGENNNNRFLLLVGDGPAKKNILDRANNLKVQDRVLITGVVERAKVADYIAAFDIALQPDVVDYASPLKLFEYMALGRAIVAPAKKNILEILTNDKNSKLFEPGNKKDFVNAIESLCISNTMREKISTQAKRLISEKKYYWDCNAKKVMQLYNAFIADP
jgi:glycosyltransferase involved in cell wall biosynthesis